MRRPKGNPTKGTSTKTEAIYKDIVESMPSGCLLLEAGRIVYANRAVTKILSVRKSDLIGQDVTSLIESHHQAHLRKIVEESATGRPKTVEIDWRTAAGKSRVLETFVQPTKLRDSAVFLLSLVDVSAKRHAVIQESVRYRITKAATTCKSSEELFQIVFEQLSRLIDCSNCSLTIYHKPTGFYTVPFHRDTRASEDAHEAIFSRNLINHVRRTRKPRFLDRLKQEALSKQDFDELSDKAFAAWLGVPLLSEGGVVGVLSVWHYDEASLSRDDLKCLAALAGDIAFAVERLGLNLAPVEVSDADAAGVESIPILYDDEGRGVYRLTPDGEFAGVSRVFLTMLGYDGPAAFNIDKNGSTRCFADCDRSQRPSVQKCHNGSVAMPLIRKLRHKNGDAVWVEEAGRVLYDEQGTALFYEGVVLNVTQRIAAEKGLQLQKCYFETLFEAVTNAIVLLDFERKIVTINHAFTRMFGYTHEEVEGRRIAELLIPPERQSETETIVSKIMSGDDFTFETVRKKRDGALVDVEISGAAIHFDGEQIGLYAIYRDVSDRKRAEQANQSTERQYRDLFNQIADPIFIFDRETQLFQRCNQSAQNVYGYDTELLKKMKPVSTLR